MSRTGRRPETGTSRATLASPERQRLFHLFHWFQERKIAGEGRAASVSPPCSRSVFLLALSRNRRNQRYEAGRKPRPFILFVGVRRTKGAHPPLESGRIKRSKVPTTCSGSMWRALPSYDWE